MVLVCCPWPPIWPSSSTIFQQCPPAEGMKALLAERGLVSATVSLLALNLYFSTNLSSNPMHMPVL